MKPSQLERKRIAWHGIIASELCDDKYGPKLRQAYLSLPTDHGWAVFEWKPDVEFWPGSLVAVFEREQDADELAIWLRSEK